MATIDKILIGKQDFDEKMDNLILAIHGISAGQGGQVSVTTWKQVQQIVRAGLARKMFSVGDKFIAEKETAISIQSSNSAVTATIDADKFIAKEGEAGTKDYEFTFDGIEWHDEHGNDIVFSEFGISISGRPVVDDKIVVHETASHIEFIIMGFDHEKPTDSNRTHSMTLAMKYTYDGIVFDAREAFFYNGTNADMPAGTYYFKMGAQSWFAGDVGKFIKFTLTKPLPKGGQLVWTQAYNATAIGANVKVFASPNALDSSPTETVPMSEGNEGTYLGEIKNGFNTSGTYDVFLNHCQRAIMGSNRWSTSAIRQWCNSEAPKDKTWAPTNPFDRQPSWFNSKDGFLHNLDPELVSVIGECFKDVELASCDGGGHETTRDKVWLFDRYEIQSCTQGEANNYPPYEWWHELLGDSYGDWRTDTRFIKTNKSGAAQYWWLRSPHTGVGHYARLVYTSGHVNGYYASDGHQAAVVFAII